MSPDQLLAVIQEEWKSETEMLRIKGYPEICTRRKEDSLVQSGHAEIEGESLLFIYGNALEVLSKEEFQKTVDQIHFQYIRFDNIVQYLNLKKLKSFGNLSKVLFYDNNLHSFIQLSKLEQIQSLQSISIQNNDICGSCLFRLFIVYRFPNVTLINETAVSEEDKVKARKQFM